MTDHPWKVAHDALKAYHAARRLPGVPVGARLYAWSQYVEALGAAQASDREEAKQ